MFQPEKISAGPTQGPLACDCHFHVFSAHEGTTDARYVPNYSATLLDWEVHAKRAGVHRGVVVQPSFLGTDNRQMLQALAQRPATLRGVAVIVPDITTGALRELHHAGVRGIRLNLMGAHDDTGLLRALPASWWSALMAADMHLELHADIGRIAALLPMVPDDLIVVLDHFAKPERIEPGDGTVQAVSQRVRSSGATYVTLSGVYRQAAVNQQRCGELASLWLAELGPDHLLWASDWPCTNFESEADYALLHTALRNWLPHVTDYEAALATNAQRLYWR